MFIAKSSMKRNLLFVLISFVMIIFSCSGIRGYDAGDTIPETDYLTFTAKEDNSKISFNWKEPDYSIEVPDVKCQKNYGDWTDYSKGHELILNDKDIIKFKGTDIKTGSNDHFVIEGKVAASGCVDSLRLDDAGKFQGLTNNCYSNMFRNCNGLITAPALRATDLKDFCYNYMFRGCTNLIAPPALPATKLLPGCYLRMFWNCRALKTMPELPATSLEKQCYDRMFSGDSEQLCTGGSWNALSLSKNEDSDYKYKWSFLADSDFVTDTNSQYMFKGADLNLGTLSLTDGYVTLYSKTPLVTAQKPGASPVLIGYVRIPLNTESEPGESTLDELLSSALVIENIVITDNRLPDIVLKKIDENDSVSSLDSSFAGKKAYISIKTEDQQITAASTELTLQSQNGEIVVPAHYLYTDFTDSAATGDEMWNDNTPRHYVVYLTILSD